jgi:hypothetical protein
MKDIRFSIASRTSRVFQGISDMIYKKVGRDVQRKLDHTIDKLNINNLLEANRRVFFERIRS